MKTLADIADDNGTFAIIAMDQRNTLRRMFDAVGEEATPEVMAQAKVDVAANRQGFARESADLDGHQG